MRKIILTVGVTLLLITVLIWTGLKPQEAHGYQGPIIIEVDREAGKVGLTVIVQEDGSRLEPVGELPSKTDGERRESINVYNHNTGKIEKIKTSEYLIGVVSGEMPAGYNLEALKAQAVAARTYLERKIASGGCTDKEGADICMNSQHCQAFCSQDKLEEKWGDDYKEYYNKTKQAVNQTSGQVLTYGGKVIEALYHSSSGESTEDVAAVYSNSLSYLVSVQTPEKAEDITVQRVITRKDFVSAIKQSYPDCEITADKLNKQVYIESYSKSGRAAQIRLGNISITGRKFRGALNLRSTDIKLAFDKDNIYITTVGHGHGVGMSQVGANIMAAEGRDYEEILKHYYRGVQLE